MSVLADDYYEKYMALEPYFRDKYENGYFSKPKIYDVDDHRVAVSPWGLPGSSTPVIFPISNYISVTILDARGDMLSILYLAADLMRALQSTYSVRLISEPENHYLVDMPYLDPGSKAEQDFLQLIATIPALE